MFEHLFFIYLNCFLRIVFVRIISSFIISLCCVIVVPVSYIFGIFCVPVLLGDLGPSQSQKLAHEMRFSLTLINSSPTPSTTDVG